MKLILDGIQFCERFPCHAQFGITARRSEVFVTVSMLAAQALMHKVRLEEAEEILDSPEIKEVHAQGPWREIKVRLAPPLADAAPQRCAADGAQGEALSSPAAAAHR